jgi:predicted transcriptional regulator
MLERVLQFLGFFCRHRHTSQPFSAVVETFGASSADWNPVQSVKTGHYIVCLDCGKHFPYDWSKMRIVKGR